MSMNTFVLGRYFCGHNELFWSEKISEPKNRYLAKENGEIAILHADSKKIVTICSKHCFWGGKHALFVNLTTKRHEPWPCSKAVQLCPEIRSESNPIDDHRSQVSPFLPCPRRASPPGFFFSVETPRALLEVGGQT